MAMLFWSWLLLPLIASRSALQRAARAAIWGSLANEGSTAQLLAVVGLALGEGAGAGEAAAAASAATTESAAAPVAARA
jgi:hypothetical protein